jgi:broad specificity phosphatase PhoE
MEGLHEHDRSNAPYLSSREFDTTVARFFAEPTKLVFGKETADTARMRFSDAISHVLRQHPAGNLAVVAHGTVITLFVARTNDIDEFRFWKGLGLPALVVLSLPDFRLIAVPEQGED